MGSPAVSPHISCHHLSSHEGSSPCHHQYHDDDNNNNHDNNDNNYHNNDKVVNPKLSEKEFEESLKLTVMSLSQIH